jgi:hypothetical protein
MKNIDDSWLHAVFAGVGRETAVEAAYYAVRELKQAAVPELSRKEHFADASESVPSPAARRLTSKIISAITEREKVSINDLPENAFRAYVGLLLHVVRAVTDESVHLNPDQGRTLLERFRAL